MKGGKAYVPYLNTEFSLRCLQSICSFLWKAGRVMRYRVPVFVNSHFP